MLAPPTMLMIGAVVATTIGWVLCPDPMSRAWDEVEWWMGRAWRHVHWLLQYLPRKMAYLMRKFLIDK